MVIDILLLIQATSHSGPRALVEGPSTNRALPEYFIEGGGPALSGISLPPLNALRK